MKNRYMIVLMATLALAPSVEAKQNAKAISLARLLQPGKMDGSTDASHLTEVETRLIAVMNALEASSRTAGPPPKDLLKRAYAMRNDTSVEYANMARTSIYDAWQEARSLGLFDGGGVFSPTIVKGPDTGKPAVFQYIIPVKYVPAFSRSFCNVELKPPTKRRVSDDPSKFDTRMIGYGKMLRSYAKRKGLAMDKEAKRQAEVAKRPKPTPSQRTLAANHRERDGRIYSLNRSKAEYEARWSELRKADPGSADRSPNISTKITRKSNPSKKSRGKYIQVVTFENRSNFPTEITFKFCFIGKLDGAYTSLLRKTKTAKILPGDKYESQESFASGKADYRGYAAVVIFGGKIISSTSSDARMKTFTEKGAIDALQGR